MTVRIDLIEFQGRIEGSAKTKPESETNETEKAAERERIISRAVTETLAVMRRRGER